MRFKNKCGIIYCISRKNCEQLCDKLKSKYNIKCDFYHADLDRNTRQMVQAKWMNDEIQIIIATIAFGMGINKKDVRFVIHYSMPKSLEGYMQECGRAGRDGRFAQCILYYQYSDRGIYDFFQTVNKESTVARKCENMKALYSMLEYCEEPFLCRRKMLLNFLGEEFDASKCMFQHKGNTIMCDNCKEKNLVINQDVSS